MHGIPLLILLKQLGFSISYNKVVADNTIRVSVLLIGLLSHGQLQPLAGKLNLATPVIRGGRRFL